MRIINLFAGVITGSVLLFSSCAKDGDPGATGAAGKDGNANVHSTIVTVNPGDWASNGTSGSSFYLSKTIAFTNITQSVLDNGTVVVYLVETSSQTALPFTAAISPGELLNFGVVVSSGNVEIDVAQSSLNSFTVTGPLQFKITAVDGN